MRVAHILDIRHQFIGKRAVGIEIPVLILLPRACVHFVDVDGGFINVLFPPCRKPRTVGPFVAVRNLIIFGRRAGTRFHVYAVRIAFHKRLARLRHNIIFVSVILLDVRQCQLPDAAALRYRLHRCGKHIPIVKIPDHADRSGSRRPNTEAYAVRRFVRTEILVSTCITALVEQIQRHVMGCCRRFCFFRHKNNLTICFGNNPSFPYMDYFSKPFFIFQVLFDDFIKISHKRIVGICAVCYKIRAQIVQNQTYRAVLRTKSAFSTAEKDFAGAKSLSFCAVRRRIAHSTE